jgi:F0F1-type ATP synthase delta subunit
MMLVVQFGILLALVFVALIVGLRHMMGRYTATTTAHLQGLSQDYLRKQEELKKRLEEAERQYHQQLAKTREEAQGLKTQALNEAEVARREAIEQARQEAERLVQQAMQVRETMQQEATKHIEARAIERACDLVNAVLPEALREAAHAKWLDELLEHDALTNVQATLREDVQGCSVVSAFPLSAAQRARLAERLQTALKHAVTLQETVDPALVAGVTMTLGHLVLDGSLASKLREAARHAQHAVD